MAKNYFAVVNKENGKFLLVGGHLPIYWNRSVAKEIAKAWKGYIVKPVDIKEFDKLVLKSNPRTCG